MTAQTTVVSSSYLCLDLVLRRNTIPTSLHSVHVYYGVGNFFCLEINSELSVVPWWSCIDLLSDICCSFSLLLVVFEIQNQSTG